MKAPQQTVNVWSLGVEKSGLERELDTYLWRLSDDLWKLNLQGPREVSTENSRLGSLLYMGEEGFVFYVSQ